MKTKKIVKGFDTVKMMREIRKKFREEIQDMTYDEERAYLDKLLSKTNSKDKKKTNA